MKNIKLNIKSILREVANLKFLKEGLLFSYPLPLVIKLIDNLKYFQCHSIRPNFNIFSDNMSINVEVTTNNDAALFKSDIENFIHILNVSGYYIAGSYSLSTSLLDKQKMTNAEYLYNIFTANNSLNDNIIIILEPLYDPEIDIHSINGPLYHITGNVYIEKIKKIGLCPKSKNKKTLHPDRVYLSPSKEYAISLAELLHEFGANTMLEISTDGMTSPRYRFFEDPNTEMGIYTYSNIPPEKIKIIEN